MFDWLWRRRPHKRTISKTDHLLMLEKVAAIVRTLKGAEVMLAGIDAMMRGLREPNKNCATCEWHGDCLIENDLEYKSVKFCSDWEKDMPKMCHDRGREFIGGGIPEGAQWDTCLTCGAWIRMGGLTAMGEKSCRNCQHFMIEPPDDACEGCYDEIYADEAGPQPIYRNFRPRPEVEKP